MTKRIKYSLFAILLLGSGCKYFAKTKPTEGERVIARVKNEFLYLSDVQPLVQSLGKEDSAKLVAAYAESWVKKNLMLQKAEEYISETETGITKKVEDYRESLLLYEYEKEFIQQKLDEAVTGKDIETYYEKYKESYTLEQDVSLINYIVISPKAKDFAYYKSLFGKMDDEDNVRTLEGYLQSAAKGFNITGGVWKTNKSFSDDFGLNEKEIASATGKMYKEFKTGDINTYIRVVETRHKGEAIPLPLVNEQIRETLLSKKRITLLRDMYDQLLEESKKKNEVELFTK